MDQGRPTEELDSTGDAKPPPGSYLRVSSDARGNLKKSPNQCADTGNREDQWSGISTNGEGSSGRNYGLHHQHLREKPIAWHTVIRLPFGKLLKVRDLSSLGGGRKDVEPPKVLRTAPITARAIRRSPHGQHHQISWEEPIGWQKSNRPPFGKFPASINQTRINKGNHLREAPIANEIPRKEVEETQAPKAREISAYIAHQEEYQWKEDGFGSEEGRENSTESDLKPKPSSTEEIRRTPRRSQD